MQRPAWFPYFDDCDAIIFLAPISCFDERLAEDRKVNRLEDSYMLWRLVCASKLLQNTQMILFLNKYDLLDQKLRRGVKVKDHVGVMVIGRMMSRRLANVGVGCCQPGLWMC